MRQRQIVATSRLVLMISVGIILLKSKVFGNDVFDYDCYEKICLPKDYNHMKAPRRDLKVYANIILERNILRKIDVYEMRLKFTPKIVLNWQDERIHMTNISDEGPSDQLEEFLIEKIWFPKITVQNRAKEDRSYMDLGRISNNNSRNLQPFVNCRIITSI